MDTRTFNNENIKDKRRYLRSHMPTPEIILWSKLKNRQLLGLKFRRQVSIGQFIVDFYCPEAGLAVEIDGDSHYDENSQSYDKIRTEFINENEVKVVRFTNKEIMDNLDGVLKIISSVLEGTPSSSPSERGRNNKNNL